MAKVLEAAVKNLPAVQETWVRSLGWEDPLEKEMAIHSSTVAWKIPWTEEPGRLQSMGSQSPGQKDEDLLSIEAQNKCQGELNPPKLLLPIDPTHCVQIPKVQ